MIKKDFHSPEFIPVFFVALHDENLQKLDCLILGTIYWYERLKDGVCKASNASIAKVVGASKENVISNSLKVLEANGYIKCNYKDTSRRHRKSIDCLIGRLNKVVSHPQVSLESSTDDSLESSTDEQSKNNTEKNRREKKTLAFLEEISEEKCKEFSKKFRADPSQIMAKAFTLGAYCKSKGKKYDDYEALFVKTLHQDFGERKYGMIDVAKIINGKAVIVKEKREI